MLLEKTNTLQATHDESEVVIEGNISFAYEDYIPGKIEKGIHWLFDKKDLKIVKIPDLSSDDRNFIAQLGFWTSKDNHYEQTRCKVGDRVIVALKFDRSCTPNVVLRIVIGTDFSILDAKCGKSLVGHSLDANFKNYGKVKGYPPMTIAYGLLDEDIMLYAKDLSYAVEQWNTNAGTNIKLMAVITSPPQSHYSIFFENMPLDTLGLTTLTLDDQRPGPFSYFPIRMNRAVPWSAPGSNASKDQFDFRTVLIHEIGHAMGLFHQNESKANVMYESLSFGRTKNLTSADIGAMKELLG